MPRSRTRSSLGIRSLKPRSSWGCSQLRTRLNTDNVQALAQTEGLLQNAIDRGRAIPVSLASYGRLLARLRELSPASGDLEKEADLFTRAARSNPYNVGYVSSAATAWFLLENPEKAREVVELGLEKSPTDRGLLGQAVAAAKGQGDTEATDAFQSRLDAIPAG